MIKIIFFISFLFYSPNRIESLEIPIITNIQDIIGLAHDIGDIAAGNIPFKNFFSPTRNPILDVLDKLDGITEKIENLDTKLDDLLATLIARLPLEDQINTDVRDLQQHISTIEEAFHEFLGYSENLTLYDDDTLLEFAHTVTSTKPGNVPYILNTIFNIIVPKNTALARVGFLANMLQRRKLMTPLERCGSPISFQSQLLQIYNLISVTEMEAFLMTMFGYRLKNELQNTKSIGEIARTQGAFVSRLDQYLIEFKRVLRKASREIYLCDPPSLTDPKNYIELEGLFTAFVINEWQIEETCSSTCSDIWLNTNETKCYDYASKYCPKHPCQGVVYDCNWIGGDVDICEYPEGTLRRYEYVRSYTNGWYGEYTECNNGTYEQLNGGLRDIYKCDTCMCKCEETFGPSMAIRAVSLRPQYSSIFYHKVVSDVRFVLKDRMIHIQIEEAPLLPMGQIAKNESDWVRLEDFIYLPSAPGGGWVRRKYRTYTPMKRNEDFAFIRGELRTLNLDEISGKAGFVVTGVRFNHDWKGYIENEELGNTSPLRLEVHVTPFDYTTGKLTPTEENPALWITPMGQEVIPLAYNDYREELGSGGGKTYKRQSVRNPPHLKPNKYIKFKQSSIHDDAGQSTLPYFDSRPTAPNNSIAFDGIGLAYRGHEEYGGFIILKALTIDATHYIDTAMTDKQRNYYAKYSQQSAPNQQTRRRGKGRRRN